MINFLKKTGFYQIEKEINLNIEQRDKNGKIILKKVKQIMIKKYPNLNTDIENLKNMLKTYYKEYIQNKLFKYELLK